MNVKIFRMDSLSENLVSLALTYGYVVGVRVNQMNIVDSQYAQGPDNHTADIFHGCNSYKHNEYYKVLSFLHFTADQQMI